MMILCIICVSFICFVFGGVLSGRYLSKKIIREKIALDKSNIKLSLLYQMLKKRHEGKGMAELLKEKNYNEVLIYGLGVVGECLYDELGESEINVLGIIDKKAKVMTKEYPYRLYEPEVNLPKANCIIVAELFYYDEIVNYMKDKTGIPIFSIEEILF